MLVYLDHVQRLDVVKTLLQVRLHLHTERERERDRVRERVRDSTSEGRDYIEKNDLTRISYSSYHIVHFKYTII